MASNSEREPGPVEQTDEIMAELGSSFEGLFQITSSTRLVREKGYYGVMFASPSKKVKNSLSVDREILVLISTFQDQQTRTLATAMSIIEESQGRLDPTTFVIAHMDPRGDAKLKKWGREQGLAVLPIFVGRGVPSGRGLLSQLAHELYSHDPFDVTGPVADDMQFYGRREEARDLAKKLQAGQIRAVFGIRKIGKTSILHRIVNECKEQYDCRIVFVDCQSDAITALDAPRLLNSIAASITAYSEAGAEIVVPLDVSVAMSDAAKSFQLAVQGASAPVIVVFDEIDYITPGSPTTDTWSSEFNSLWRNIRASYQTLKMNGSGFSLIVSGVSSKWFSQEAISGVENAALFFVPDEYLGPLPRGAAIAMIRRLGRLAGLSFGEESAAIISAACADMPFWIRKACSFIHSKIEIGLRPFEPQAAMIDEYVRSFIASDGTAMAEVALAHLFRVYPELKAPALQCYSDGSASISRQSLRVLQKYGIVNNGNVPSINGSMISNAIKLFLDDAGGEVGVVKAPADVVADYGEWADELAIISRRRNIIEKKLRDVMVNFIRYAALTSSDKVSAKERILKALDARRRAEFESMDVEAIAVKLYWLELVSIVKREWVLVERIFGDKAKFAENAEIVNDRPDAHAKELDLADLALHRRALTWFEERLSRV